VCMAILAALLSRAVRSSLYNMLTAECSSHACVGVVSISGLWSWCLAWPVFTWQQHTRALLQRWMSFFLLLTHCTATLACRSLLSLIFVFVVVLCARCLAGVGVVCAAAASVGIGTAASSGVCSAYMRGLVMVQATYACVGMHAWENIGACSWWCTLVLHPISFCCLG
jgi:hypothetical protein